jgi:hypothetical protein
VATLAPPVPHDKTVRRVAPPAAGFGLANQSVADLRAAIAANARCAASLVAGVTMYVTSAAAFLD